MGSLAFLFVLENYIFIGTIYLVIAVIGGAVLQDFSLFVSVIIVGIICSIAIVTVGHLLPAMLLGTAAAAAAAAEATWTAAAGPAPATLPRRPRSPRPRPRRASRSHSSPAEYE